MPKGVRLEPAQIVAKLREIEVKIGQGKDVLSAFQATTQIESAVNRRLLRKATSRAE